MSRLTITLEDSLHQALKETAARQGLTIGRVIEEALQLRGIKPQKTAHELLARVRKQSQLDEADALELAVEETRAAREA
jgi:predicted DNA-binding ribbon-helix-helix protein